VKNDTLAKRDSDYRQKVKMEDMEQADSNIDLF